MIRYQQLLFLRPNGGDQVKKEGNMLKVFRKCKIVYKSRLTGKKIVEKDSISLTRYLSFDTIK